MTGIAPMPSTNRWDVKQHVVIGMIPLAPRPKRAAEKNTRNKGAGITAAAREMNEHDVATTGSTPVRLENTAPSRLPVAKSGVKIPPTNPDSILIQKVSMFAKHDTAKTSEPISAADDMIPWSWKEPSPMVRGNRYPSTPYSIPPMTLITIEPIRFPNHVRAYCLGYTKASLTTTDTK